MPKQYHDPDWLHHHYWKLEKTQKQIATESNVSPTTIRKLMKKHGIQTRTPTGKYHGHYGKPRNKETKQKISQTLKGRDLSSETRGRMSESHTGTTLPAETREKISESLNGLKRPTSTRKKMSESRKGEQNPMWKGGHSKTWYDNFEWTTAKNQLREKQSVCQFCGHDGSDHLLDVHHIVPIRLFAADDYFSVIDAHHLGNLIRLCRPCHIKAEALEIELVPKFRQLPDNKRSEFYRLWKSLIHG